MKYGRLLAAAIAVMILLLLGTMEVSAGPGDKDDDGVPDAVDACPNDPDNDKDGDGQCGDVDPFPNDPDDDKDGDGLGAAVDACPNDPDNDKDSDGICGDVDAFPNEAVNTCFSPSDCFFSGFDNFALGNATLSLQEVDGVEVLQVDNIGSDLTDGVAQLVPKTQEMKTTLITSLGNPPNFSASTAGATLLTTQTGIVDGQPNQLISSMSISNIGGNLVVDGDWSPIGTTSYEIQIFDGSNLVTSQKGLTTGQISSPLVDVYVVDCTIGPGGRELTYAIHNDPPVAIAFTIPGRGTFFGDNVAIIAEGFTLDPTAQTRIEMLAANMNSLTIVTESATKIAVGGIVERPDIDDLTLEPAGSSDGSSPLAYAGIAVGVAAAVLAIAAGGWYARRRWLR